MFTKFSLITSSLIFVLPFLFLVPITYAGNTVSVNNGALMRTLQWAVGGGAPCLPSTTYQLSSDGIAASWNSGVVSGNNQNNFGGVTVDATAALGGLPSRAFPFTCTIPPHPTIAPYSDTATLLVCDNISVEADGAGGCKPKSPDLIPVGPPTVNGVLDQNSVVTFSGQVRNNGTMATPNGFSNNFSYRWGGIGAWIDINFIAHGVLTGLTNGAADTSSNLNLSGSGVLEVQYCVDSYNQVIELGVAEGNECQVSVFNVTPAPAPIVSLTGPTSVAPNTSPTLTWTASNVTSVSINQGIGQVLPPLSLGGNVVPGPINVPTTYILTAFNGAVGPVTRNFTVNIVSGSVDINACVINPEASSCGTSIIWNSNNFTGATEVSGAFGFFSNIANMLAPGAPAQISPEDNTFTVRDLGSGFSFTNSALATCNPLSLWISSATFPPNGICASYPVITLTPKPDVIRSGRNAEIEITIDSLYNLTCTFQDGGTPRIITHNYNGTRVRTITESTRALTSAQLVKMDCIAAIDPNLKDDADVKVNVVPTYQET